jgi:hypothetical protein
MLVASNAIKCPGTQVRLSSEVPELLAPIRANVIIVMVYDISRLFVCVNSALLIT